MKVPRTKAEPGKGGFWTFNPEYQGIQAALNNNESIQQKPKETSGTNPSSNGLKTASTTSTSSRKRKRIRKRPSTLSGSTNASPTKICLKFVENSAEAGAPGGAPCGTPCGTKETPNVAPPIMPVSADADANVVNLTYSLPIVSKVHKISFNKSHLKSCKFMIENSFFLMMMSSLNYSTILFSPKSTIYKFQILLEESRKEKKIPQVKPSLNPTNQFCPKIPQVEPNLSPTNQFLFPNSPGETKFESNKRIFFSKFPR